MTLRLAREQCVACTGATAPLAEMEHAALLRQLARGWRVSDGHLLRTVPAATFADAFTLATRIALLAEAVGHHPTLTVEWGRVTIDCITHAIAALSRNDFRLAARIDELCAPGDNRHD
ncbi:MAG TPA: 4a-hydroxytetrahydrobiopterin dehydratase [Verrucomicrobiae bacterium]|nr:4a-hydroxytetrahydrobiopterin dehydratase [Verrucomicrobiae bacterium]